MKKVKRNAPDLRPPTKKEQIQIASNFAKIGKENGIVIHSCCEKTFLSEYGLKCNGCMSQEIVEKSINCKLEPPKRKNLRQECNCLMENDIGAYNTCGHLCKYCYANSNKGIITNIGNENKQMWFATLHIKACPLEWRWCYDRSSFITNNILTFICFSCRNYYSICLNYIRNIFKQIDK